jgi:hypothetical protein
MHFRTNKVKCIHKLNKQDYITVSFPCKKTFENCLKLIHSFPFIWKEKWMKNTKTKHDRSWSFSTEQNLPSIFLCFHRNLYIKFEKEWTSLFLFGLFYNLKKSIYGTIKTLIWQLVIQIHNFPVNVKEAKHIVAVCGALYHNNLRCDPVDNLVWNWADSTSFRWGKKFFMKHSLFVYGF